MSESFASPLEIETSFSPTSRKFINKIWLYTFAVIILIPYICVAVLFGLFGQTWTTTIHKSYHENWKNSVVSFSDASVNSIISKGTALYLSNSGKVKPGGGTSIYKNVTSLVAPCPSYLDVDVVLGSLLISYGNPTSNLVLMNVSSNVGDSSIILTASSSYYFYQLETLHQDGGLFVGIAQDSSSTLETAYIAAGKVSVNTISDSQITLGNGTLYAEYYSFNPCISRMSDTSFAISYYDDSSSDTMMMATRYGVVDPTTLSVTLTLPVLYASDSNYTVDHTIIGIDATSYLLIYYDSQLGPLNTKLVTVTTSTTTFSTTSLTISSAVPLTSVNPVMYLKAVKLTTSLVVVVFVDSLNDNRLTCVVIDILGTAISYGSILTLSTGKAMDFTSQGLYMDLNAVTLASQDMESDQKQVFAVLYSDLTDAGKVTTIAVEVTDSSDLKVVSPEFVLTSAVISSTATAPYFSGAMAAMSNGQIALLYTNSYSQCNVNATITLSLMSITPRPIGLANDIPGSNGNVSVAVRGSLSGITLDSFEAGLCYFADSLGGGLVNSGIFYGHLETGITSFVESKDGSRLLAMDALVGFALTSDTLALVTTK